MLIFYLKAMHIIGFVAWFAGLFYLVRIFVYHAEAKDKPNPDRTILINQFKIMEGRVYNLIAQPAMIFTIICGVSMLFLNPSYLQFDWMKIKLSFLVGLVLYHFRCRKILRELNEDQNHLTSFQFRLLNELPTLFLIAIVLLAVLRTNLNPLYILFALIFLGLLFFYIVKIYKRSRERDLKKWSD